MGRVKLKNIVELAITTIQSVYHRKDLSDDEKKQVALKLVKNMRYNTYDYLWINDMHPTMVMHPFKPALDGKDLSGFKDPNGKKLFVEMVHVCNKDGKGIGSVVKRRPVKNTTILYVFSISFEPPYLFNKI